MPDRCCDFVEPMMDHSKMPDGEMGHLALLIAMKQYPAIVTIAGIRFN